LPKGLVAAVLIALAPVPALAQPLPFVSPEQSLTAPIALMIDAGSGRVLYERDSHRRFVPASLTKVMTAYVAFELIKEGKLDPRQRFRMSTPTFRAWHNVGSTMFLAENSEVSVDDLLRGIVTVSANDACIVLAEGISGNVPAFTRLMNEKARELGMRDSHFNTPNGWMDEGRTFVSAADLAALSRALIERHPALYKHYFGRAEMSFNGIDQPNHNPLYGVTAGSDGVKTGFTNEAGYGFVGSVIRNGRRVIMVVAGYDRGAVRRDESRAFVEWAYAGWDIARLFEAGAKLGDAEVQGGTDRHVAVVAPRLLYLTVSRGEKPVYTLSMRYRGPVQAPVAKGQDLGQLVVTLQDGERVEMPLVAGEAVPAGNWLDRLRNGLLGLIGL
jgi:D-alanyl-D-alanine carboxypeptidase (penicillin-binding protein 5/6)